MIRDAHAVKTTWKQDGETFEKIRVFFTKREAKFFMESFGEDMKHTLINAEVWTTLEEDSKEV